MAGKEIRFVNGYGGMMVKFCEDCLVIAFRSWEKTKEATRIPYGIISNIKFSSWSGLQITTKDNWNIAIYIQEKKQIKFVVNSVLSKINKPTQKVKEKIMLTDEDIEFIKIATKVKRNEQVTEQEKRILEASVEEQYDNTKKGKFQNRVLFLLFIVVCLAALLFLGSLVFSFFSSSSDSKDGFIGSDGKYHEYVPEFGDDVNNWMEENW